MLPAIGTLGRVVVCEDDELTRDMLCDNLAADRFEPIPAPDAESALRSCRYEDPDALLLDLGLPDASGLDVLREIRVGDGVSEFDTELPVIILSGLGSAEERVRGLGEGADDYMVKPYHYRELLLRLRHAVVRRARALQGPVQVGDLRVDGSRREVRLRGELMPLTTKEFELVHALALDPHRVFTKDELLKTIWGYRPGTPTRTLDSHASRLRRKLDPVDGRFVVNCWGVGYRLVKE